MWILYNVATGTILETDPEQPTGYSPDKAAADVDFVFLPGQPLYLLRFDGSNIVPNSEVNIKIFSPFQSGDVQTVLNKALLNSIVEPELNQIVYVQELDISFRYNGTDWKQSGEETNLRYGLGLGFIYALNIEVG